MKKLHLAVNLEPARNRAMAAWTKGDSLPGADGLIWLERAHRLAPADQNLCFAVASRRLQIGRYAGAARLFATMAAKFAVPECWAGLAASQLALGRAEAAADTLQHALSTFEIDSALADLATRAAARARRAGWCGLRMDGLLLTNVAKASLELRLDGHKMELVDRPGGAFTLPAGWRGAQLLDVHALGEALLGSPIAVAAIGRVEGFVERQGGMIRGTAWLPAAPGRAPTLRVLGEDGRELARLTATGLQAEVEGSRPLVRERVFACAVPGGETIRVVGGDERDLLGSPLPPEQAGPPRHTPRHTRRRATPMRRPDPGLPVEVIIPVYRGLRTTLDCIQSVLASVGPPHRIHVVDDASPEPALFEALERLAAAGRILLSRTGAPGTPNRGFPAAVNVGLRLAGPRHVILLNSDTLVAPGWLEALRAAACVAPDIGTVTPLSNAASIFSYPKPEGGNPPPDLAATTLLAAQAASANKGRVVDVPTAHGFCMFIRADCLAETGLFDAASFAQGYGEENDFTERARALGWRHVAATGVFVAHHGGVSFGGAGLALLRRNLEILGRRYPDYRARVADFIKADRLAPHRRRLDAVRWAARPGRTDRSVLLITHGVGGGTARVVAERAEAWRAQGFTPVVLREVDGLCEVGEPGGGYPNLAFDLPADMPALARLLRAERPAGAELHHLLGHDHSIMRLLAALGLPYDVWVHDYAWFCARLSFVTGEGRFCGEAAPPVCELCLARWGRGIEDPVAPADLRRRSAADLRAARAIVVSSLDVARRVARHVPGVVIDVRPWEPTPPRQPPRVRPRQGRLRVVVVGAIGLDKGAEVLLACARDAAARDLELDFTVVGYTQDDDPLMETGRVFVTGEFQREEAAELIRAQDADLAFLPSIWPETWCYALSDIWEAGLSAAVFDIGTPSLRVRQAGRGWVLPLGLPAARVNDVLLTLR